MSTSIDQKAYLQKYLNGRGEKKKKKKKSLKGHGFKIIDDDIDISKLRPLDGDELDILGEGEDAPQVAGIIDDRPDEIKKLEQFSSNSKWRVISKDDGFNSKLQIEEIKMSVKEKEKENELMFGKMYSDSEDEKKNDSDLSPPRKSVRSDSKDEKKNDSDSSPPRKSIRSDSKDAKKNYLDLSPPRKRIRSDYKDAKKKYSDISPPRKSIRSDSEDEKKNDSDLSPPRKSVRSDSKDEKKNDSDSSPPRKCIRRGKRETSEERRKKIEKVERQKELDEKYTRWGKGIKQLEDQKARVQEFLHEASKPMARFKNDADLEGSLKSIERHGDPMLKYIRERKRERGELAPEKPMYKGSFPPNRFNIRPGYRWDGVDRSNGYEKKYFDHKSKRKAQEEEAYKWSTEDL